jgi:hypothetical protein
MSMDKCKRCGRAHIPKTIDMCILGLLAEIAMCSQKVMSLEARLKEKDKCATCEHTYHDKRQRGYEDVKKYYEEKEPGQAKPDRDASGPSANCFNPGPETPAPYCAKRPCRICDERCCEFRDEVWEKAPAKKVK